MITPHMSSGVVRTYSLCHQVWLREAAEYTTVHQQHLCGYAVYDQHPPVFTEIASSKSGGIDHIVSKATQKRTGPHGSSADQACDM